MGNQNRMQLTVPVGAVLAATASTDIYGVIAEEGTWRLEKAYEVPHIAATAHATNFETTTVYGSNGSTALATGNTSTGTGSSHVAGTARNMAVTNGGTLNEFAQGASVKVNVAQAASGVAVRMDVVLVFEKVRTA